MCKISCRLGLKRENKVGKWKERPEREEMVAEAQMCPMCYNNLFLHGAQGRSIKIYVPHGLIYIDKV